MNDSGAPFKSGDRISEIHKEPSELTLYLWSILFLIVFALGAIGINWLTC